MSQTTSTPAGWYADPVGGHQWRYFDGHSWTDTVADQGVTTQAPLAAPAAASDPNARGKFTTRWIKLEDVTIPRRCVACGGDATFESMAVGAQDVMGKLFITLQLPLCADCTAVLEACGSNGPEHRTGGLVRLLRVPAPLKARYKTIAGSAKLAVKRMGLGGTGVRFTFTSPRFAEAFEQANPPPPHKHFWQ